ncbi:MAG: class I SAM-dependent methyltransferase [Holosporales bacterium]|nr:class I SAM-dependent methyltransferase [Holosporales bacterium]
MSILDIGCGTGINYPQLSQFGTVDNIDCDDKAIQYFSIKNPNIPIFKGSLPNQLPEAIQQKKYDLIVMLDILEHIQDDIGGLITLHSLLSDSGKMLITVPACQFLYGKFDSLNHHYRRYSKSSLEETIRKAGFSVSYLSYFNFFLFPLAALVRLKEKYSAHYSFEKSNAVPCSLVNLLCRWVFGMERYFLPRFSFPIGLSLIAVITPTKN